MQTDPRQIQIKDYDYPLPEERIAKFPIEQRDHSKLLVFKGGKISHVPFYTIAEQLEEGMMMVFNNTRVIQARLHFRKETGALIEVFLLEPEQPRDYELMFQTKGCCRWQCLVGNLKKWKGQKLQRTIMVNDKPVALMADHIDTKGTSQIIEFTWDDDDVTFSEIIDAAGELPIPPYLNRDTEESDKTTYQTVYSKIKGSVAAPTAGLHFTEDVLDSIDKKGILRQEVTLHVGAGTFRPVKSEQISDHDMHTEYFSVKRETIECLLAHKCETIAVGTTSVRTLESLYYIGKHIMSHPDDVTDNDLHVAQWEPYNGTDDPDTAECLKAIADYLERQGLKVLNASTQIIIAPGYKFHIVKRLVTNFHQPKSTLLLLISALVGDDWHRIYDYALANNFRFLSYGDSSLIEPTC